MNKVILILTCGDEADHDELMEFGHKLEGLVEHTVFQAQLTIPEQD